MTPSQSPGAGPDQADADRTGQRAKATLVEGPIGRTLLLFSLPILAGSVLQSLNASINAAWIGHLLGEQALTASANANSVLFFLLSLCFGLAMAASILVAQSLGANNLDEAKRTTGTAFTSLGAVSAVMAGVGIVAAPHMLLGMRTPPDALPLAAAYLRVIFAALPGIYLYTLLMMALRGAGDARTPFVFLLILATLDVGLNPVLITGLGGLPALGIAGSALATLIGQYVALGGLILWLYLSRSPLRLAGDERRYLRIDPVILRTLIIKGVPMGLQLVVLSSSMIVMISFVNRYGSETVAAYGACFQLWNYIQMPAFAVGSAVSAMAAQNVGARRWDRVGRITAAGVLYNVLLTGTLVLVLTLIDRQAFAFFLGPDEGANEIARHIHLIVSWSFVLFGISFVLASVVRSTGAVMPPLIILFIAMWVVRIPLAEMLEPVLGADGIWWSFPAGSFTSLVLTWVYFRFGRWRQARMLPHPAPG